MDSQWPRYEVFQQDRPDQPFQSVGSVHAPDPELALQNARDVFARRPHCHGLWVVPAAAILSRTAEQLASMSLPNRPATGETERFHLFQKQSQRASMSYVTQVAEIRAASAKAALQQALAAQGPDAAYVWWIVPERAVTRNRQEEVEVLFGPAETKHYRHPNQYRTVTQMQQVRQRRDG